MTTQADIFTQWLDAQELAAGNITDYEVAKKGGFSHSVLSRARSGIPPKWDVCVNIAAVFSVSPVTVFRKAGLLPPGPDDDINFEDWQYLLKQLTPEERDEMRQIFIMKIDRRQKSETAARAANFKPDKVKK